jgi:hypothetical protein
MNLPPDVDQLNTRGVNKTLYAFFNLLSRYLLGLSSVHGVPDPCFHLSRDQNVAIVRR